MTSHATESRPIGIIFDLFRPSRSHPYLKSSSTRKVRTYFRKIIRAELSQNQDFIDSKYQLLNFKPNIFDNFFKYEALSIRPEQIC